MVNNAEIENVNIDLFPSALNPILDEAPRACL